MKDVHFKNMIMKLTPVPEEHLGFDIGTGVQLGFFIPTLFMYNSFQKWFSIAVLLSRSVKNSSGKRSLKRLGLNEIPVWFRFPDLAYTKT